MILPSCLDAVDIDHPRRLAKELGYTGLIYVVSDSLGTWPRTDAILALRAEPTELERLTSY